MKKTIIILLLISFLFNTLGVYIVFYAMRYENKERIAELIHKGVIDDYLILLKIPDTSFQRLESDEIKYNGNMYDIIKEERHNDLIYFYCISDETEDELIAAFENYTSENSLDSHAKNKTDQNLIKQLLKDFIKDLSISSTHFFYFSPLSNHTLWSLYSKSNKGHLSILIAPPRLG